MANEWTDSSFELGLAGLTLEGSASVLDSPGYWPDGTKGLVLQCSAPPPLGGSGDFSRGRRTLTTTPGETYAISAQIALALDGSPRSPLSVQARTVGGTVLATYSTTTGAAPFALWSPGSFVATEAQTIVEWRAEEPASGGAAWAVDLVSVEGADVSKLLDIRDAIVASLGGITVAGGYSADLTVYDGYKAREVVAYPNAQVVQMGENKEMGPLQRKLSVATFGVFLFSTGDGTLDALYELAKDVETKLETVTAGQFLGLSYVNDVVVTEVNPFETEETIHYGTRQIAVSVDVTYRYQRTQP